MQGEGENIASLFATTCLARSERPAMSVAFQPGLTYGEMAARVLKLAAVLREEGIEKGDRLAILAENSCNWGIAYLAAVSLGGVVVPILPDLPEADVHHILRQSGSRILFTSQRQLDRVYEFQGSSLGLVVTLDDSTVDRDIMPAVETFAAFLERPVASDGEDIAHLGQKAGLGPDDLASIIYTSGTSGHSKAVLLTHANFCSNARAAAQVVKVDETWTFLSILPLSHAYEFTIGFLLPLAAGARILYAGRTPTPMVLEKICAAERPTALCVVPLVMEKIYKKRVLAALGQRPLLQKMMKFGLLRRFLHQQAGKKLIDFFGGQLQLVAIGGAALNPEVEGFLREARFPFIVGYGLTEAAPLLAAGPLNDPTVALSSCGKPVPGVEIRLADPDPETGVGEIQARGPNVMQGYSNDPEETAAVLSEDGWLSTGDLGSFDPLGNLYIKGRLKNVIVMANGENVYPEIIEHKINANRYVAESIVVEHGEKLEAWVYCDYDLIDAETEGRTPRQRAEFIEDLLVELRLQVNDELPPASRLSRVLERKEPFVKTATQKIKRYLYQGPKEASRFGDVRVE